MVTLDCNNMKKGSIALLFFLLFVLPVFAQRNKAEKTEPVIVVGKFLNQRDSMRVKELFFDGLQDKISMNYAQAASTFSKILDFDPSNDAVLYELANISFSADKPEYEIENVYIGSEPGEISTTKELSEILLTKDYDIVAVSEIEDCVIDIDVAKKIGKKLFLFNWDCNVNISSHLETNFRLFLKKPINISFFLKFIFFKI